MAKKKDKSQVINNIQEMNLEIDYDKLAEAIVKAQRTEATCNDKNENNPKLPFHKRLWNFLSNRSPKTSTGLNDLFQLPILLLFRVCAISCCLLLPIVIWASLRALSELEYGFLNFFDWAWVAELYILAPVFLFIMVIILWDAANQLSREKDQSIIMATFSNTVSLVALIIAFVALFKGVG